MISYTNISNDGSDGGTSYHTGAALLKGNRQYCIPWVATARPMFRPGGSTTDAKGNQSGRSAQSCYMVGLKERIQIQTSTSMPWQWRRICFTFKARDLVNQNATNFAWTQQTSNGMVRTINDIFIINPAGGTFNNFLWSGKQSVDWSSYYTAKVDTSRVNLLYDKTRIIRSGNDSGVMRNFRLWHPMRKTLIYDDEENGGIMDTDFFASSTRQGMGDFYVVDLISCGTGGSANDLLSFDPEATLYWHER